MPPIASPVSTLQGAQAYSGGFAFNLPGIGTIYSTNITPDKETGIGNYTDQQFLDAMHKGIRRDGARLDPAMSYTTYSYMTDGRRAGLSRPIFSLCWWHMCLLFLGKPAAWPFNPAKDVSGFLL